MKKSLFYAYLKIERVVMVLDARNDGLADILRDGLDPIWNALTEKERDQLNKRPVIGSLDSKCGL